MGCAESIGPFIDSRDFPDGGTISEGPSISTLIVQHPDKIRKVCLGRGADAAFEREDGGNISISIVSVGKNDAEKSGIQDNAGDEEMAGRTPAVLLARELFYRACEFSTNYQLTKQEAIDLYTSTLQVVQKGWENEAQKTTITIGDKVATTNSNTFSETSATTSQSTNQSTNTSQSTNSETSSTTAQSTSETAGSTDTTDSAGTSSGSE